ncbi:Gfo/Idh/MocA family oxidoreductase [Marinoscillum sp. MHG1-6]|uniref:Gfo/Idh/MocA family oxidoreductase n=1 Tax=Marinoscillum sp. MHG1-6 TaxID=2959627 RepID=UPI0021589496|nr:Gfo/Idh/MocA family oxidoreductase [Marinoscillum sp. MHG1-6]
MKNINAALLSFGMSGHVFHAPFIHLHPGFTLLGAWERTTKKIQEFYPEVKSYESKEAVLDDPNVDLVVVNTPTYTHYEYTKKVLEAGKHAVVEKAFTTTTQEAEELRDLAKSKGLKLCVFQNRRWDSDFKTVKEVIQNGMIGEVVEATIGFLRYNPNLSPKTHKEKPSPGAGIMKDLGPHVIDQALDLFGMPKSVFADIAITRKDSEVDDYFDILLKYDAFRVHIKGGYFFREMGPSYILHGTKGSFLKSRGDVQEDQLKLNKKPDDDDYGIEPVVEEGLLHTEIEGKVIRKNIPTHTGNYKDYYEGVYQAIANGEPEPVTAQDGVNVMKIIDAAFESAEHKKVISF